MVGEALACATTVAGLVLLVVSQANGGSGGSFSIGGVSVDYRLDGPSWVTVALYAAGLTLIVSAILLWIARRRSSLVIGFVLLPLALAGGIYTRSARSEAGRVSSAQVRAVPPSNSREALTRLLGAPAGHGEAQRRGARFDCLIYKVQDAARTRLGEIAVFCFTGDRFVFKTGTL